jgi:hypothetical protein
MGLRETDYENVKWIVQAYDMIQWQMFCVGDCESYSI